MEYIARSRRWASERQRRKVMAMLSSRLPSTDISRESIESEGITVRNYRSVFVDDRQSEDFRLKDKADFAKAQKGDLEAHIPEIIKMSLLGASILTGNPAFYLLLKAFTGAEFAIKAAKELERKRFVTRFETAIKTGIHKGIHGLMGNILESFADEITEISAQYGITEEIAKQTNYNEDFVKEVFQRTANSLLDDGTERLANMVYDIV